MNNPSAIGSGVKKSVPNKNSISKFLRRVTEQEGFHFYIVIGEPTGEKAVTLADFAEKMEAVDVRSVNFHYLRKDFEKWIREVIGDAELALRLGRIGRMRIGI